MAAIEKKINPFTSGLYVQYVEMVRSVKADTVDSYEVEQARYSRLYISREIREFIFDNLTMYARDMILMMQYAVNPNYQYVILNYEKICKVYGKEKYGRRRYDDTIRELQRYSILDLRDKADNSYWYNPNLFSPSSRLTLFPDCKVRVGIKMVGDVNKEDIKKIKAIPNSKVNSKLILEP